MNNCKLCNSTNVFKRNGKVRDNNSIGVLECYNCGLVFLSSFEHIKNNYYEESHQHDDPLEYRTFIEYENDDNRRFEYCKLKIEDKKHLDFGCGEGGFLLKTQKITKFSYGFELEEKSIMKIRDKKIKVFLSFKEMENYKKYYDIITLFHVLEHMEDPISILLELKEYINETGEIMIEVPNSDDILLNLYNNEGFSNFYWSCHLYIYNIRFLNLLFKKVGLKINYIQQIQRYPLSNHLYWLANNYHGGHFKWSFLDNDMIQEGYKKTLCSLGMCDTLIANVGLGL